MKILKLLLAYCLFSVQAQLAASPTEIYRNSVSAVVLIIAKDGSDGNVTSTKGTGSVVANGYILTNAHVISRADGRAYEQLQIFFSADNLNNEASAKVVNGKIARLVAKDDDLDLALLQVKGTETIAPLPLAYNAEAQIGEEVLAIGHPENGGLWSLTSGRIGSRIANHEGITGKHVLQTEASLNRGNSGGPLLNYSGEIIGVNTSIARTAADGLPITGINFAVRADVAYNWMESLDLSLSYASLHSRAESEQQALATIPALSESAPTPKAAMTPPALPEVQEQPMPTAPQGLLTTPRPYKDDDLFSQIVQAHEAAFKSMLRDQEQQFNDFTNDR